MDSKFLTGERYTEEGPLAVRMAIHELYTVPAVDLARWALDLLPWQGNERVADVSGGNDQYRASVVQRLRRPKQFLVGDMSLAILRNLPKDALAVNLDARAIPLPQSSYDVVLVNHVLCHVPDIDRAVAECHRVLRDSGRLLVVANSQTSMTELAVLIREGYDRLDIPPTTGFDHIFGRFSLENGQAILRQKFDEVERHILHSAIVFSEPAPLLAYIDSLQSLYKPHLPEGTTWDDLHQVWHEIITDHIARHGTFRIGQVVGAFVAVKLRVAGSPARM